MGFSDRIKKTLPLVVELYSLGKTCETIAKELGINVKTVRKILHVENVDIRGMKLNLLGKKFFRLTPIKCVGNDRHQKCLWLCKCDCGSEKVIIGGDLISGKTKSCGCHRQEISTKNLKPYLEAAKLDITKTNFTGCGEISGKYISSVKNRAMDAGLEYALTNDFLWDLFLRQDRKCALSGLNLVLNSRYNDHAEQTASLDRIDSKLGYVESNVQWVHKHINNIKQDYPEDLLIRYCELVYKRSLNKRGVLYGTRTYLAGNLEFSSDTTNWRKLVKDELGPLGIKCFNPMEDNFVNDSAESDEFRAELIRQRASGEWNNIHQFMKTRIETDLRLIDIIDFAIFNFEFDKPTYGTTHELILAKFEKKPIFIIAKDKRTMPLWLMGLIPEKYIYSSIYEVIDKIKKIDSGEINIDSIKWHLLKPELR